MSRTSRKLLAFVALLLTSRVARGQDTLRIDLASAKEGDTTTITPGRYRIRLASRVPRYTYTVHVAQRDIPIPPISSGGVFAAGGKCDSLVAILKAFNTASREQDIPDLVPRASAALASDEPKSCISEARQVRERIDATESVDPTVYTIKSSQYLIVTIDRSETGSSATRQWVRVYTSGGGGGWRTTFGYALLKTTGLARSGPFSSAQGYYTKQVAGTTNQFVVTAEENRQPLDAVPTVVFGWMGESERGFRWNRLTAGLGVDLTNPFLMIGTGLTYNANLHFGVGVAARREEVLLGRYHAGDTVTTELSGAQLTSAAFRVRPVVALTLRFDSNPFSKGESSGKSTEGKTPAKAEPTTDSSPKPVAKSVPTAPKSQEPGKSDPHT